MTSPVKRYRLRLKGNEPSEVVPELSHRVHLDGIYLPIVHPPPVDTPAEVYVHYAEGSLALLGRGWVSHIADDETFFELEWASDSDGGLLRYLFGEQESSVPAIRLDELESSSTPVMVGEEWSSNIIADLDAMFLPSASPRVDRQPSGSKVTPRTGGQRPTLADLIERAEVDSVEAATTQPVPVPASLRPKDPGHAVTAMPADNVVRPGASQRWNSMLSPNEVGEMLDVHSAVPVVDGWLGNVSERKEDTPLSVDDLLADLPAIQKRPQSSADFNVPVGSVFALDLSSSAVTFAIAEGGEPPRVLELSGMGHNFPAVVALLAPDQIVAGIGALEAMVEDAGCGLEGVHRLLGRPFHSAAVHTLSTKFGWTAVEGPDGQVHAQVGGHQVGLNVLVGKLLRSGVEAARAHLTPEANRIVLTCPAFFGPLQRAALAMASEDEGLCVEALVSNCLAAVVHHVGLHNRGGKHRVLAIGLDEGALDVALVEIQGRQFSVLASGGDEFAGGVDVYSGSEQRRSHHSRPQRDVAIDSPSGVWLPIVDKVLFVAREVCTRAQVSLEEMDELILFGAEARDPHLFERLDHAFHLSPLVMLDAEAVALGAAEIGRSLDLDDHRIQLMDCTVSSLGVGRPGGQLLIVVPRGVAFPAFGEIRLKLSPQMPPEVLLFEGDAPHVERCDPFGRLVLEGLPAEREHTVDLVIRVCVGEQGQVDLQAIDSSNGNLIAHRFDPSLSKDHIHRWLLSELSGDSWVPAEEGDNGILGWLKKKLRA